jgi:hypothetical protein
MSERRVVRNTPEPQILIRAMRDTSVTQYAPNSPQCGGNWRGWLNKRKSQARVPESVVKWFVAQALSHLASPWKGKVSPMELRLRPLGSLHTRYRFFAMP